MTPKRIRKNIEKGCPRKIPPASLMLVYHDPPCRWSYEGSTEDGFHPKGIAPFCANNHFLIIKNIVY
jgi:hypothetical protein